MVRKPEGVGPNVSRGALLEIKSQGCLSFYKRVYSSTFTVNFQRVKSLSTYIKSTCAICLYLSVIHQSPSSC